MKNLTIIMLLIACSTQYVIAQAVHPKKHQSIISTKIVVLRHEDQTDTLLLPQTSKVYPLLQKALSDKKLLNDGLDSVVAYYKDCGCGTTSFRYDITYESKDVISFIFHSEFVGAYPYSNDDWLTLDIHTGEPYLLSNEINSAGLKWIKTGYKAFLKESIRDDKKQVPDEDDESFNALMKSADQNPLDKYIFTDKGITFSSYGVLPHVNMAFEPSRDWPVSYTRLKRYKKPTAIVFK